MLAARASAPEAGRLYSGSAAGCAGQLAGAAGRPGIQNNSFSPNCNCRAELFWPVILPNWFEFVLVLGKPNCTLLVALKASPRNCTVSRSLTREFLSRTRRDLPLTNLQAGDPETEKKEIQTATGSSSVK